MYKSPQESIVLLDAGKAIELLKTQAANIEDNQSINKYYCPYVMETDAKEIGYTSWNSGHIDL